MLEISRDNRPGVVILNLKGSLHMSDGEQFENALLPLAGGDERIILDCAELAYISSVGARVILEASRKHAPLHGPIFACSLKAELRDFMNISGLDVILRIVEALPEALPSAP
jgi:anti-anti-sigma factor